MFRKTIQQARERMPAATPADQRAAIAYRDRVDRIMVSGVECAATLRSFSVGHAQPVLGGFNVRLDLSVEPADRAPYDVSFDQILPAPIIQTLAPDQRLTVKVASDDPTCVMLWNTPHAAGGADPETGRPVGAAPPAPAPAVEDRIARLERLQALRASGALTDDEFEAQKARVLRG